jgi:hypothetical protein
MENHRTIAAKMLGGENGWEGLLHYDLINMLDLANMRCHNAGGRLTSRQAISAIITAWELANQDEVAYGE